jgi:hypothetical protein
LYRKVEVHFESIIWHTYLIIWFGYSYYQCWLSVIVVSCVMYVLLYDIGYLVCASYHLIWLFYITIIYLFSQITTNLDVLVSLSCPVSCMCFVWYRIQDI